VFCGGFCAGESSATSKSKEMAMNERLGFDITEIRESSRAGTLGTRRFSIESLRAHRLRVKPEVG
jgi:hypothetical protein